MTKNFEIEVPPEEIRDAIRRAAHAPADARVEWDFYDTGNSVEFKGAKVTYSKTGEVKPRAPRTE